MAGPAGASLSASAALTPRVASPGDESVNSAVPLAVSASSAAATVTDCATFQLDGVNVSDVVAVARSGSPPSALATVTVTSDAGCTASDTPNDAVAPSATFRLVDETTISCP